MLVILILSCGTIAEGEKNTPTAKNENYVPTEAYEKRQIEGWTVFVNKALLEERSELGDRALRLLEVRLFEIQHTVPAAAVKELKRVPIWLGFKGGQPRCAAYHPSREWLSNNGFNTDKAKAVEISNAENFLAWSQAQPCMVLHEMAHAYHDRVLGWGHEGIMAAYKAAKEKGDYEEVLHYSGRVKQAYAMNNHKEYFAEATEAYFGTNDFYPFMRAELRGHDKRMLGVLEEVWKVRKTRGKNE
jgi:hypothetical protein